MVSYDQILVWLMIGLIVSAGAIILITSAVAVLSIRGSRRRH